MGKKLRLIEASRSDSNTSCVMDPEDAYEDLRVLLEESSPGEAITFTLVEMDEEEFDALSEFEGW